MQVPSCPALLRTSVFFQLFYSQDFALDRAFFSSVGSKCLILCYLAREFNSRFVRFSSRCSFEVVLPIFDLTHFLG